MNQRLQRNHPRTPFPDCGLSPSQSAALSLQFPHSGHVPVSFARLGWVGDDDQKTLIPPFRTIDGLGDIVAHKIVEERELSPFFSIEDLQNRGKVSQTLIDKMRIMGILSDMPETSQLSLF